MAIATEKRPCHSCRKRRVRCDFEEPACARCIKDQIHCPGYGIDIRFKLVKNRKRPAKRATPPKTVQQIPTAIAPLDQEELLMLNTIRSFNDHLLPLFIPAHPPFSRWNFQAVYFENLPLVIKRLSILLIKATTLGRTTSDTSIHPEILHHRGLAISELAREVACPANLEGKGLLLGSVLMMRTADMQVSKSSRNIHGCAADQLITKNGGAMKCCDGLLDIRHLILGYMVLEIYAASQTPISALDPEMDRKHIEWLKVTERYEDDLYRTAHICPLPIFHALICTNIFRQHSSLPDSNDTLHPQTFTSILNSITSFSATKWADQIVSAHQPRPQPLPSEMTTSAAISAWTAVALSHQAAALLYLCLSTTPPPDFQGKFDATVRQAKAHLHSSLSHLFVVSSMQPDDPIETQLWKYVQWPLTVSAYVTAEFGLAPSATRSGVTPDEESFEDELKTEIDRIRKVARFLGARPLWETIAEIEVVATRRRRDGWGGTLGFEGGTWRWWNKEDDGGKDAGIVAVSELGCGFFR
jgi:hypothetical protein